MFEWTVVLKSINSSRNESIHIGAVSEGSTGYYEKRSLRNLEKEAGHTLFEEIKKEISVTSSFSPTVDFIVFFYCSKQLTFVSKS